MGKVSVTKLTLFILVSALVVYQWYILYKWGEINQLFTDVMLMTTSFYFWQKWIKYDDVDSIIEEDKDKPVI